MHSRELVYCAILIGIFAGLAQFMPAAFDSWWQKIERGLVNLARHQTLCWVGLGVFVLLVRIAFLGIWPIPKASVYDEFSYLLQADTFAHGRLTNPPHSLWVHFDSMHIIQQPTYASKYPPAQGALLAVGQVVCGQPIVGAWLSGALASAAICWMLFAFVPPR